MKKWTRFVLLTVLFLFATLCIVSYGDCGAWRIRTRWNERRAKEADQEERETKASEESTATLVKFDINKDGLVNDLDRLMWLEPRKPFKDKKDIPITPDEDELINIMDSNSDGKVSVREMQDFYNIYDKNRSGKLEDWEKEYER